MNIQELAETFDLLGDWEERYGFLIDLGRKLPPLPAEAHTEANQVRGCMSQVWMTTRHDAPAGAAASSGHDDGEKEGALHFLGDSDSHLVKGLIALLFVLVDGKTPAEIRATDIAGTFRDLGLESHITANRRNGFFSMVERVRQLAAERSAAAS